MLSANSVLDYEFAANGDSDLIAVSGALTLDGTMDGSGATMGQTYTLFTYTGAFADNGLTVTGLPSYLRAEFDTSGGAVTFLAIPEPSVGALLVLGTGFTALRRRRTSSGRFGPGNRAECYTVRLSRAF